MLYFLTFRSLQQKNLNWFSRVSRSQKRPQLTAQLLLPSDVRQYHPTQEKYFRLPFFLAMLCVCVAVSHLLLPKQTLNLVRQLICWKLSRNLIRLYHCCLTILALYQVRLVWLRVHLPETNSHPFVAQVILMPSKPVKFLLLSTLRFPYCSTIFRILPRTFISTQDHLQISPAIGEKRGYFPADNSHHPHQQR